MADTAAMPLITSNPVNIVSADYFGYSFVQHFLLMGPVGLVTIVQTMLFLYLFYRRSIPREYSVDAIDELIRESPNPPFLRVIFATLFAINVGYIIASFNRVPVSFVILTGAVFLFVLYCGWYISRRHDDVKDGE